MRSVILVPIYELDEQQCASFKCVLERIKASGVEALIVEQETMKASQLASLTLQPFISNKIRYVSTAFHLDVYCKRRLIEFGSQHINRKYVWVNDHDTICDFATVNKGLLNQDLVQPYSVLIEATKNQSKKVLCGGKFQPTTTNRLRPFGLSSWVMKRQLLAPILKGLVKIDGRAWEDYAICDEAVRLQRKVSALGGPAVRLYHPSTVDLDNEFAVWFPDGSPKMALTINDIVNWGEIP
ncbi:MAG: hypothetical protein HC888_00080 [Candidatus Competibacteraceae bacterium]|nr:hypothetical protein [Candidatus Competibacteraceae bacterium]